MGLSGLVGLTPRVNELGRIRLGDKEEFRAKDGTTKTRPAKLETFRLTSHDRTVLEKAAQLYGGKVEAWTDAPDEGMWELTTAASELDIIIPRSLQSVSQNYELWQGGTCERRCDGRFEEVARVACLCDPEARDCAVMTRISVILPRLPGLGLWRLDTKGWHAATTLPSTIDLLLMLSQASMVPAVLRAEQRSKKVRDANGKVTTNRFVVPVLGAPGITIGQLVSDGALDDTPQLEAGERPTPPTAADRVAQRRAAIEEAQAVTAVVEAVTEPEVVEGSASKVCGAIPAPGPLGLDAPCTEVGDHTIHKSPEGSWPR